MEEREDGFRFPTVDTTQCINCKRCDEVCPITKEVPKSEPIAYAAVCNHSGILEHASSGGVFGAIASYVLESDGVVYGCAFTQGLEAKHIRVESKDDLPLLFGSKYVQSNTNTTYILAKKDLEEGRWVLFSGTPCQIAGFKRFIGKDYSKLLLVDIICHGVPSQAYFDKYIKWLSTKEKGRIVDYQFRSKSNHGWSLAGEYKMECINGKIKRKKLYYFEHYYYYYFLESSIYRECCYNCKYASLNREGDFSLGDLWGAEMLRLDFDISKGCSLLLVNTQKAFSLLDKIDVIIKQINIEIAEDFNEQLVRPSKQHSERENRLRDYQKYTGAELQRDFCKKNIVGIVKGRIKYSLPTSVAHVINRFRFRIRSLRNVHI